MRATEHKLQGIKFIVITMKRNNSNQQQDKKIETKQWAKWVTMK